MERSVQDNCEHLPTGGDYPLLSRGTAYFLMGLNFAFVTALIAVGVSDANRQEQKINRPDFESYLPDHNPSFETLDTDRNRALDVREYEALRERYEVIKK